MELRAADAGVGPRGDVEAQTSGRCLRKLQRRKNMVVDAWGSARERWVCGGVENGEV